MMMGYYDNIRYNNMYAGPANGGVCPMENDSFWGYGESPLSATHIGIDGRTARGHVEDYWIATGDPGPDPYINNGWVEHVHGDCTADFMGTSQSKFSKLDGSTSFINATDGSPLEDFTYYEPNIRDGCHGLKLFANSRGYTVTANFSQYIYGYNGNTLGFTYDDFKAEIDANRPVIIHLLGHSMLGYGYNDSGSLIYVHDTWDNDSHSMTWGGTYAGMQHTGVTVLRLAASSESLPVIITVQPQDRTSHPGSPASFSVTATGDTPRYYQWQKNSVNIPSATSASHTIASVSASDAGSYRCRVSNEVNAVMSDAATLTVLPAAPSAIWASATNVSSFTAAWNSVSDATSYRLDVASTAVFGGGISDLIISEYVEGSSTEKFLEIYNGTGFDVDLSDYRLIRYANGSTSPTEDTTLSGLLGDGEVVVYRNPLSTLYACETNRAVNFNGNDAVVLFKISAASPVDIFGCIGEDPGDAWTNGSFTTANKTLVRKSSVVEGVTENLGGFPTLATEWEQYDQDTISFLGSHDCDGGGGVPPSYVTGYSNRYVSGTSQNVTGLAGDTVYYFRARAVNGSGTGRNSPLGSVRTWLVPTFGGNPGPVATTASVPVAFTVNATGNPEPSLALKSTTASGGYGFIPETGRLDYVPPQADAGARTFTFTASNRAGVATQTVNVGVTAGIAPSFTSGIGPYSTTVDVAVAFAVSSSGRPAPALALQSTTATGSYSFAEGTGQLNFTPSSNDVGTRTFTFAASNFLGVATQTVSVATMGLVPTFNANPGPLGATTSVAMAFTVGASGVPPPELELAGTTASGGYGFTPETGELAYTPPEVDAGLRTFTVTASNSAGVATQTVEIAVAAGIPSAPAFLWAAETNIVDFRAEWSSVPIANSYQLDVATNDYFSAGEGEGGQFMLASNAATSTNLFTNEWTAIDIASTTYIQMLKPTSAITSPAFSTVGFTNLTVDFRARTYNGTASGTTNITVSISTNNGIDWSVIGVVAPSVNTMTAMPTLNQEANLEANQTRIRWQTLGASGSIGVGVSNLVVQGWSAGGSPSFVAGYSNRLVGETSDSVTGLVANTPYYFRVRTVSDGGTGTYSSVAGVTTDVKSAAAVYLQELDQTYEGTIRAVTATTMPAGLAVEFTYDGNPEAPTNAGSYVVVGTIDDPIYLGSATNTLVVRKAAATVTLENLLQIYDGTPRNATAATDPPGLAVDVTYDGLAMVPATAGTYAVTAIVDELNYEGGTNGTLVVDKGVATVFLQDLAQTYSGLARTVSATTMPAGLTVELTYDGQTWAPTNAGSYAVTGTVQDANWAGEGRGTLTVARASQAISVFVPTNGSAFWATDVVGLSATADSGLAVAFRVATGPGEIDAAGTNLSFSGAGVVAVEASQDGDANWLAADPATNTVAVGLPPPAAIWASATNRFDFTAEWSPVPFATEYRLDVGLNSAFEVAGSSGGQFLLASNAATSTNLFTNEWTASDISSTTYIQMLEPTSVITSPAFSTVGFTNLTVDFRARTYGGTTKSNITVSISEDDGATWFVMGVVHPANGASWSSIPTLTDAVHLGGEQTRIRWQALDAGSGVGVGVSNLVVQGWSAGTLTPAFVAGYSNRPAVETSLVVTGLNANARYCFRVCAVSGEDSGPYSSVADVLTKSEAKISLQDLAQTYDGTARTVSATTEPSGLAVEITYDGSSFAPTNAGTYAVTGRVTEANYAGETNGVLVVSKANQTIDFPALGDQIATGAVELAATASSGLPVLFGLVQGPATLAGTGLSFTGAGEVVVAAWQAGDANWHPAPGITNVFAVEKASAEVTLNDLAQIYDGTARAASAATEPSGLAVEITYEGSSSAPTNAGIYAVTGTVADAIYKGSATGTLAIAQAPAAVTLNDLAQAYEGTARTVSATTEPPGLAVEITYDGSSFAPTNAGSYAVTGRVAEANYAGETNGVLVVSKADQTIDFPALGGQIATNELELAATASSGLPVSFVLVQGPATLAGMGLSFTGAGEVAVAAQQDGDANWCPAPGVTNVFAVDKAAAEVALNNLTQTYDGTARMASAATEPPSLAVEITYDGSPCAPTNAGSYAVTGTVADAIYQGSATGTMEIAQAPAEVTLNDLAQTYDGTARTVSATTEPPGLAVEITYDGSSSAPTNAGTYAVTGAVAEVNYFGFASGTLLVNVARVDIITLVSRMDGVNSVGATITTVPADAPVTIVVYGATNFNAQTKEFGFERLEEWNYSVSNKTVTILPDASKLWQLYRIGASPQ